MSFEIFTDTSANLPAELVARYGIDKQLAMTDSERLINTWAEIGVLE